MINAIIAVIAAYFIGAIPSGLIIGKCYGKDIRKEGSCNTGATNVTRCVGKKAGVFCFFCDFLKGAVPVLIARFIAPGVPWAEIACFAVAVLGHMFPVYLKFKGGKGIATAAGGAFAIAPLPLSALVLRLAADPVTAPWYLRVGTVTVIAFAVIGALAIFRHRSNIQRLLNGTESRFEKKKPHQSGE